MKIPGKELWMKGLLTVVLLMFIQGTPWIVHSADNSGEQLHRIGVLAKRGPEETLARWQATAEYLGGNISGHRFEIVPLSFTEILDAVRQNRVEFVLANPAVFLTLSTEEGIRPLATLENLRDGRGYPVFGGVIFVRADSSLYHADDLDGASFAAVSKKSLGGWLMELRELKRLDVVPAGGIDAVDFVGTHDAVVFAVRDGRAEVGTVRTDTLERMQQEGKINLRDFRVMLQNTYYPTDEFPFLHSTPLYPEWPFAAVRSVPELLNKKIAVALLSMRADSPAARSASISGWDVVGNYQPIHELEKELRVGLYEKINYLNYRDVFDRYGLLIKAGAVVFVLLVLLLSYLFHLKRILRADIRRRKKIEHILKTTNRKYYEDMKHSLRDSIE
jgi:ABC-type phosphate/phosphonate transport system substrate-binding protein